jgi:formyl-CoA transferase
MVGRSDLANDPRFQTVATLGANAKELHDALLPWLQDQKKEDIYHAAQARGIPACPIPSPKEVVEWGHLKERGHFLEIEHPEGGTLKIPGPPFREYGKPLWPLTRAPLLGEHTGEVLGKKLGYTAADVQQLRDEGIV